jgi:protoporphyrinogen oxidase
VELRDGRVSVQLRRHGVEQAVEGDFLVSTIPIGRLVRMLQPTPPAAVMDAARFLRHRMLLLFFLCLNKERALDNASIYFTEPQFLFRRITEFKHLSPAMAPDGKTSLCVEITHFEDESLATDDPAQLLGVVVDQLEGGGLLNPGDVGAHHFLRVPNTYPVYEVGYPEALEGLLNYLATHDNVISIGRQGLFFYNLMHNCMLGGYQVGQQLGTGDRQGRRKVIESVYEERKAKYRRSGKSATLKRA